jgi:hypothetical protein
MNYNGNNHQKEKELLSLVLWEVAPIMKIWNLPTAILVN